MKQSGDGGVSSFSAERRRHILTYTLMYTVHPLGLKLGWTLKSSLALSHSIHTPQHTKRRLSASSLRRSGTWSSKRHLVIGCQHIWVMKSLEVELVTEPCPVLLEHAINHQMVRKISLTHCWSVLKLKLTFVRCLVSPLHARTQPEPATRAQDQSMDQPSWTFFLYVAKFVQGWHTTMTMEQ